MAKIRRADTETDRDARVGYSSGNRGNGRLLGNMEGSYSGNKTGGKGDLTEGPNHNPTGHHGGEYAGTSFVPYMGSLSIQVTVSEVESLAIIEDQKRRRGLTYSKFVLGLRAPAQQKLVYDSLVSQPMQLAM